MPKANNLKKLKIIEDLQKEIEHFNYSYYELKNPEISDEGYDEYVSRLKKLIDEHPIEDLRKTIRYHDYAYHILQQPEISDKEYDNLVLRLKEEENKYPFLITKDSPTQRVSGKPSSSFTQVRHSLPMLSLDNTYSEEEIQNWSDRVIKLLETKKITYVLNPKIDGLSLSLVYKNGILDQAATRGDGEQGENVTLNARTIKSVPLKLKGSVPELFEVRGEVYIEVSDFKKMNESIVAEGGEPFVNPRNAGSGALRQKDPRITAKRPLRFFAHSYGQVKGKTYSHYTDFLKDCEKFGIPVAKPISVQVDLNKAIKKCLSWQNEKEKWKFEIDGVVIRIDSLTQQKTLGTTAKAPRWAIAYKFPASQATTKILNVEHSLGRTGIITPTAHLEPVECGGVTISNATLHNYDEVKRLGVKIGDTVFIERAGEVIPKVIKVVTSKRTGNEKGIAAPKKCPSCQTSLVKIEGEVAIRCPNGECPVQIERGIIHFASRDAMDIEGMGEAVVLQLVKDFGLKDVADIYALKKENFLKLELFKEKRAQNLVDAIEKSKKQPLDKLIYAFGVPNIGEKVALTLAENFGSLSNLSQATQDDLESIPDIGPIVAKSVKDFFTSKKVRDTIKKLKVRGVDPKFKKISVSKNSEFFGKTVVFTGELKSLTRSDAEKMVRAHGGKATGSVSKKTDFVVVGENPGSKAEKAKKLNVFVLSEAAFLSKINKVS